MDLSDNHIGLFFFLLFLLLIFGAVGWVGWVYWQAKKQGLPAPGWRGYIPFMKTSSTTNYPTPRSSGPVEWVRDQLDKLRNKRTARGAYEETSGEGGYRAPGRGSRGVEDDAWDTRVGRDEDPYGPSQGYSGYEEQELGLAPTPGLQNEPYGGTTDYTGARGHQYQDSRGQLGADPFGDHNEAESMRSVSPRPADDRAHTKGQASLDSTSSMSPSGTRKSAFREGI